MPRTLQGILAVLGRVLLCTIFFTAAVGNKIPNFRPSPGTWRRKASRLRSSCSPVRSSS